MKDTRRGKSRLQLPVAGRVDLVRAIALDTAAAVMAAPLVAGVLVIAETDEDADVLGSLPGVDARSVVVPSLNAALRAGLALVDPAAPVATLPADLPGLRPADLSDALTRSESHPFAVVSDRHGIGTTLLAAQRPELLRPHYGPDSFQAHLAAGAVAIELPADSSLRNDVDDPDDLRTALGPRSAAVYRRG